MQIKCPSCGLQHNTEDHPGAFEIMCSCGYSILVPDEAQMSEPVNDFSTFTQVPVAMEMEDHKSLIAMPDAHDDESMSLLQPVEEFQLTPSSDLPPEMPYDSFELNQQDFISEESALSDSPAEHNQLSNDKQQVTQLIEPKNKVLDQSPFQQIVDRSLASNMGQWLGDRFHLKIKLNSQDDAQVLKKQIQHFLENQPWLLNELKKNQIDSDLISVEFEFDQVPEIFAIEIYLSALELGGVCEIKEISL